MGNLGARCYLPLGQLRDAEAQILERISSAERLCDGLEAAGARKSNAFRFTRNNKAIGHSDLGYLYGLCGRYANSHSEFERALEIFRNDHSRGMVEPYKGEIALLQDDVVEAQECGTRAARLTATDELPREVVHLNCLLGNVDRLAAEVGVNSSDIRAARLGSAESHLNIALETCRRVNLLEAEPKILIAAGHLHRVAGEPETAHKRFEEALTLARLCEYRLNEAEAEYGLAELAMDAGAPGDMLKHAGAALQLARSDSEPYTYAALVARAARLLDHADDGRATEKREPSSQ